MRIHILIVCTIMCVLTGACKKSKFLDAKPNQGLIVPQSINELQALLDNTTIMNGDHGNLNPPGLNPVFGLASSDDYYIINSAIATMTPEQLNLYTWNDDIYSGIKLNQWDLAYRAIFYANIVLAGLDKITPAAPEMEAYENAKGSALFFRAEMFFELTQIYAAPYDVLSPVSDPGIILRLKADINEPLQRATLPETYKQIIEDLKTASGLLPDFPFEGLKNRPSKVAALGLLARVYLTIGDYENALDASNQCLQLYDALIDYNDPAYVSLSGNTPSMKKYNPEVIFHSLLNYQAGYVNALFLRSRCRVDSNLVSSYNPDDLRSQAFFRNETTGGKSFRGSYDGSLINFGGIATDEIYLIRAESYARLGDFDLAMDDLNSLMIKRWNSAVAYPVITATDADDALQKILAERRKELLFRGLRWIDLRRLNIKGANITVQRIVNGQTITLPPNSLQYTFLIPPDIMGFNPGIEQNKR